MCDKPVNSSDTDDNRQVCLIVPGARCKAGQIPWHNPALHREPPLLLYQTGLKSDS